MSEATTLSLAPSPPAATFVPVRLGAMVRIAVYGVIGVLFGSLAIPQLNVAISGLPFGLVDYVFFGAGLLGFLVVPMSAVPATVPMWIIVGWAASLLLAGAFAVERQVALKEAIALTFWGGGALGLSRFAIDPAIRRAFAVCLVIVGARWGAYAAGAYQHLPAFESIGDIGLPRSLFGLINHNGVAAPIAAAAGFGAGYFIGQGTRTGYIFAAVVLGLGALTISFCLSRQGVVALFGGTALAMMRARKATRGLLAIAVIAAVIAVIVFQAQESGVFGDRTARVEERYDPFNSAAIERTTGQRQAILERGISLATRFPGGLIGIGSGNFPHVTETGARRYTRGPVLHNAHFTILVEGGVLAFLFWIALLRRTVFAQIRQLKMRPLDMGLVTAGLVYTMQLLFLNRISLIFWMLIAGAAGAVAASRLALERSGSLEATS